MNITAQEIDPERGLRLTLTSGKVLTLTRQDVLDAWAATSGSRAARIDSTRAALAQRLAAESDNLLSADDLEMAFEDVEGRITEVRWGRR